MSPSEIRGFKRKKMARVVMEFQTEDRICSCPPSMPQEDVGNILCWGYAAGGAETGAHARSV